MKIKRRSSFSKFLSGKGFYIALSICLLGAAGAAYVGINQSLLTAKNSTSQGGASGGEIHFPTIEDAGTHVSGVPNTSKSQASHSGSASSRSDSSDSSAAGGSQDELKQSATQPPQLFKLPLDGDLMQDYSFGEFIKSKTLGDWRTHNGIDIKAKIGTPVKAVADGTVQNIVNDPLWGWTVEISHSGGLLSRYCGLSSQTTVKKGQAVVLGQILGVIGETNQAEIAEEAHLHFEIKKDGKFVDPLGTMGMRN